MRDAATFLPDHARAGTVLHAGMHVMTDPRSVSYWLETCGDDLTPRPSLAGSTTADVAILGAGFTGLWTAQALLERDPSLRIVVLEREVAGFGASGRNGGWCYPGFPVTLGMLRDRFGPDAARALTAAMHGAVDDVARVCASEGIDAGFTMSGMLRLARGKAQLPGLKSTIATARGLGLDHHYQELSAAEVRDRVRVTGVDGGIFMPHGAAIHPAKLARGLARAVERRGAVIHETTPVTEVIAGKSPRFVTPFGDVSAHTLVLAGEAYLTQLPQWRRAMIPVYSLIVLTEPISDDRWAEIGWQHRELLASSRYSVDYLQRTEDGRVLFGGRGAPYRLGSRIEPEMDRHGPTHAALRRMVTEWFPPLAGVRFTHAWGGPLGMPRDWMPTMRYDAAQGIAGAWGYTGQGVATANLSGRVLADLITARITDLTTLPTVNHHGKPWEPEPFRWAGIRYVQGGFGTLDRQMERTGKAPSGRSLVERLGRH
jgi:glycine/D-amino acid oxidase-like deaminating enzyme